MKYDFDEMVNRYDTLSAKWYFARLSGKTEDRDYRNPEVALPFMVADMDLPCPDPIVQALHRTADERIFGYSFDAANPAFAQSVVNWYQKRFHLKVEKEWLLHSPGTVSAVNHCVKAFSNVGDGVIITRPVYGHFTSMIEEETYRKVVDSHLISDGNGYYTMNWEDFEAKCAVPTNKIFILCSPENPIGRVWTVEELRRMCDICRKHKVLLVSDEIHADIVMKGISHHPILEVTDDHSNIIMISGINKTFNVAGLACSTAIIPDPYLRENYKKEVGMILVNPFSAAAQIAGYEEGEEWLDQALAYIEGNIDWTIAFLKERMPKVKVWKPEGTYCLWLDFNAYGMTDAQVHELIYNHARVLMQDGIVHDPEQGGCFQRLCVPCSRLLLQEAMVRVEKAFAEATAAQTPSALPEL